MLVERSRQRRERERERRIILSYSHKQIIEINDDRGFIINAGNVLWNGSKFVVLLHSLPWSNIQMDLTLPEL